jgi:hypothetical protein
MLSNTVLVEKNQIATLMKFTLRFCEYVSPVLEYCSGHFEYDSNPYSHFNYINMLYILFNILISGLFLL